MTSNLPPWLELMKSPRTYPHPVKEVQEVQTHISHVFLAGDYVYKIKKPVDFGFLDFTTLAKRRHFCEREIELNRRLCPGLYLGLSVITRQDGGLTLDGPGQALEYAVRMQRMPEAVMMGRVIAAGQLTRSMIKRIVDILVPFYRRAANTPEITAFGQPEAVGVNVTENFDQTEGFIGCPALNKSQFETVSRYARDFLKNSDLFTARMEEQRIRDCHGDLYSANICLDEEVHVFDCIEFNERFRYCDVASDVAFLAMDLDFHGLAELSDHFIKTFIEQSEDQGLLSMLVFYKCYRAYVRGKIGLFTAHAPEVSEQVRCEALEQAGRYFKLAEQYAENG